MVQSYSLGKSSAVTYKTNIVLPYDPTIMLLGIYSTDFKTMSTQKYFYMFVQHMNIYSSNFFRIAKNIIARVTKISFNRWIDKQIVVHPHHVILFSNKKKWAIMKDVDES